MSSRGREENFFHCAPHRFALNALDLYAVALLNGGDRTVPDPAMKAAAGVRAAEHAVTQAEAGRDAALLQPRSPTPDWAAYLTNMVINALGAPRRGRQRRTR